jgi:phosphatidylserine/phosphatidylglycerophosphate/cardiolipin synthase-like enzyme
MLTKMCELEDSYSARFGIAGSQLSVEFFTGSQIVPMFLAVVKAMRAGFVMWQYTFDHTAIITQLMMKLYNGAKGRIIVDKGQFFRSSCYRQAIKVKELRDAGCEFRVLEPVGLRPEGYPIMHAKTLIVDKIVAVSGSMNLSHGGAEDNKEHVYRITCKHAIKAMNSDFEDTWKVSEEVTDDMVKEMLEISDGRTADYLRLRGQSRSKSRSASVSRGRSTSRSLGRELAAVAEDPRDDPNNGYDDKMW